MAWLEAQQALCRRPNGKNIGAAYRALLPLHIYNHRLGPQLSLVSHKPVGPNAPTLALPKLAIPYHELVTWLEDKPYVLLLQV
jgi:hypothetical protein